MSLSFVTQIKNWIYHHQLHEQFFRFIIIGLISTFLFYLVFVTCLRFLELHYLMSNIISFACGVGVSYPLNRKWTFAVKERKKSHFLQYFTVYFGSLLISCIFLKITVDWIGLIPEIASLLSIGITTCTNFFGIRFLVFQKNNL